MSQTATAAAQTDRFGVPLKGWSLVSSDPDDGASWVMVACERCGDGFLTDDPDSDTLCCACSMPPAEVAALRMVSAPRPACDKCGFFPLRASDDGRCAACTRLYASLTDVSAARKEDAIAA